MLSITLMPLNSARFWNVRPPISATWRLFMWSNVLPRKVIEPSVGVYTPLMQLSIDDLPAPLGPMMERISCSFTLNEMSVSAFTPPKRRLMFLMSRMTSPIFSVSWLCVPNQALAGQGFGIHDGQCGAYAAGAAVLELDLRLDELLLLSGVQGIDQHAVLLRDEAAAHLARAGQLVVVGSSSLCSTRKRATCVPAMPGSLARSALTWDTQSTISSSTLALEARST